MTLDRLSGIDWDCPKLAQLEQFALDRVDGATSSLGSVSHIGICVAVQRGRDRVFMCPDLRRKSGGSLEWVVVFEAHPLGGLPLYRCALRSDEEIETELRCCFHQKGNGRF